jgi:hypothetical protein
LIDQLPTLYGIGVLVALLNNKNKRLGDFVAGSLVVREAPFEAVKPLWSASGAAPLRTEGAGISLEDLALIETFLNRRQELTADVRSRMAQEILDRITSKTPVDVGQQSTESVLEALAYQRRGAGYS